LPPAASAADSRPIRRIVLWLWNADATPERRLRAKEGLAYIRFAGHVDDLDFGEDLGTGLGPGRAFDLALLRDHVDRASWDAYVDDPHHFRVGNDIDTISQMELTARVDYLYSGPPSRRGAVRHIGLYRWRAGLGDAELARLRSALSEVRSGCPMLRGLAYGPDLGLGTNHHDWAIEAHVDDTAALQAFFGDAAQRRLAAMLDELADPTATARLQHRMLSG
jgi:hypothetical protein